MRTRPPARLAAVLCACLMFLGLGPAALASAADATRPAVRTWHVLVGGQGHHRAIQTMGFYPKHLWVDQGDTVEWDANAWEIHTVTFFAKTTPCPDGSLCDMPPGGFSPDDPVQATAHGSHTYDGTSFYSSGVVTRGRGIALPPSVTLHRHYRLTFPEDLAPGTYRYYCLVHGKMSMGTIVVQAKGTPYPFNQKQYFRQAHRQIHASVTDGERLWAQARRTARRLTRRKPGVTVLNGVMDERAMVMRFIPARVTVRAGHRVHFVGQGPGPHTVTFGNPGTGCGTPPCNPELPWNVVRTSDGNLRASFPGRNGTWTGDREALSSGIMLGLPPTMTHLPQELTVRFTRRGTFPFVCALHAYMGMVGSVHVRPRRR